MRAAWGRRVPEHAVEVLAKFGEYPDPAVGSRAGWNARDKKIAGIPTTHIRPDAFNFDAGRHNFVPIFEQSRYKYLIYVEGHCAACRYGFMMRLGSVILKVESLCVADGMRGPRAVRPTAAKPRLGGRSARRRAGGSSRC